MERKNRIVFILLITVVILAAVLASFGPTLFSGGTPRVELPDLATQTSSEPLDPGSIGDGEFTPVSISRDTVQSVIETLDRPTSYSRTITLDTYSGGRQYTASARVWADGGWTKVELTQQPQPRGSQHTLVGPENFYRWYGYDRETVSGSADQWDADLAQRIPSYQDVLELEKNRIVHTGYVEKNGLACIYVEVSVDELGYAERYWVSVTNGNGLLMACETIKDGEIVMAMSSTAPETPVSADANFTLPDGTVLHQAGEH